MTASFPFWRTVTTLSLLITVVTTIGLISLSESLNGRLNGLQVAVILVTTMPLAFLLMGVRKGHRPTLLVASLLSFVYFSAGIMIMTTHLSDSPIPLIYILSVVLWFSGSLMMLKTKPHA